MHPKHNLPERPASAAAPAGASRADAPRRSLLRRLVRAALPAAALVAGACISDGPNQTGGAYLERHGIVLETPLHRVVLEGFPVDTVWSSQASSGPASDTLLLLGSRDGFNAQLRLGFNITDPVFFDALGDPGTVRLSLGFPRLGRGDTVLRSAVAGVDSMRFLVESWAVPDSNLSRDARNDLVASWTRPFFAQRDTSVVLDPSFRVTDTVVLAVATAYAADTIQDRPLPALRTRLLTAPEAKWHILTQLTWLPDTAAADTGAMLRVGGRHFAGTRLSAYAPALLFGDTAQTASTASTKNQRFNANLGFDSRLWYTGPAGTLLTGINRGLHLSLDRGTLLAALDSALAAQGIAFRRDSAGEYDLGYFVPYARIGLPIDTPSRIEGNYPLEFALTSDLDSLMPGIESFALSRRTLVRGDTANGRWVVLSLLTERHNASRVTDTVLARYVDFPGDPGLRRLVLRNASQDSTRNDTLQLTPGQRREATRSGLVLTLQPGADSVVVDVHLNTRATRGENLVFRDPATGEALSDLAQRIPRFLEPGDDTLSMRATRALQQVLNRTEVGGRLRSDIQILPVGMAAADPKDEANLSFPILAEVRPRLTGGVLRISLTLYLYPLKER